MKNQNCKNSIQMLLPYGLENDHVRNEDSKPGNSKNPAEMQEADMDRTFTEEM